MDAMGRALRVAHIDDDDDLRAIVGLALRLSDGLPVLSCSSGAMAQREVPSFMPDVILVDYMMPGMDGIETVARLRTHMDLSGVSVIFATASHDESHRRKFEQAGAAGVIFKPFDANSLGYRIRELHGSP